jgi:hypothetical protein
MLEVRIVIFVVLVGVSRWLVVFGVGFIFVIVVIADCLRCSRSLFIFMSITFILTTITPSLTLAGWTNQQLVSYIIHYRFLNLELS